MPPEAIVVGDGLDLCAASGTWSASGIPGAAMGGRADAAGRGPFWTHRGATEASVAPGSRAHCPLELVEAGTVRSAVYRRSI